MTLRMGFQQLEGPDANPEQNPDDKDTNWALGPVPRNQNITAYICIPTLLGSSWVAMSKGLQTPVYSYPTVKPRLKLAMNLQVWRPG